MKYPDWTPPRLLREIAVKELLAEYCEDHGIIADGHEQTKLAVLKKAATDDRMERVWKSYKRQIALSAPPRKRDFEWFHLPSALVQAITQELAPSKGWERLTFAERAKLLHRAMEGLDAVEALIDAGGIETPLWNLVNQDALTKLVRDMEDGKEWARIQMADEEFESPAAVVTGVLGACGDTKDIIENMRRFAEGMVRENDAPQLVEKPAKPGAEVTRFVRSACIWHRERFGLPLYENAAILASVFLDVDVQKRTVIESFRPIKEKDVGNPWGRGEFVMVVESGRNYRQHTNGS